MRAHRRRGLVGAAALLLLLSPVASVPAAAQDVYPRANDARRLADESVATQARFFITFGEQAPARWVAEHNAELAANPATSPIAAPDVGSGATPIAFQAFEHGFMLWRKDNDQITVGYADILTKTKSRCQETYRDTYRTQPYTAPVTPAGISVNLGFGWLLTNDSQLAQRLGAPTSEEVSRVTEIHARPGEPILELRLDQPIPDQPNPLVLALGDEPGLTYCFPRGNENRSVLNTWVALQRFEHGQMRWRQDRPERIEVVHFDTDLAPEVACVDILRDTWAPGEALAFGDLALSGRQLPERGFGKIWLTIDYVRESLGDPVDVETGGFAEITFERFKHPRRGPILVRRTQVKLPSGRTVTDRTFFPGGGDPQREDRLTQGCQKILIPHAPA